MSLRISEVAQAAGVNRETLRYYERRGLLEEPERSPGGRRLYADEPCRPCRLRRPTRRHDQRLLPAAVRRAHHQQRRRVSAKINDRHLFGVSAATCAV